MSSQNLFRQLIPIVGPGIREIVWLVHYFPVDKTQSDFFRIFTDWEEMLNTMSLPVQDQHPAWQHPFEIFMIDFENSIVQEISEEILRLIEMRRKQDGMPEQRSAPRTKGSFREDGIGEYISDEEASGSKAD